MSERTLDADLKTGAESAEFGSVVFISLAFASGTVYMHNGVGTLSFGGNDYLGVGTFGSITTMEDSMELKDPVLSVQLSAIDEGIIAAVQTEDVYGLDADVYIGRVDTDNQLVGTPTNWISGFMERASLRLGTDNVVDIKIQTRAGKLNKTNNKRYTLEEHQVDNPGDLYFEFLHNIMEVKVQWAGETGLFKNLKNYFNTRDPRTGQSTRSIGGG